MVSLKYFSNFWGALEITLIKCEINFVLTWPDKFVLSKDTKATTFSITDTKRYVLVITLSMENNAKLLEQSKSSFKRTLE